jgi:iron(III) transport system substrate-binding protein
MPVLWYLDDVSARQGLFVEKIMSGTCASFRRKFFFLTAFIVGGLAGMAASATAASINIYSHRQQALIQPFLDAFTAKTGIETNVVYAAKGLAQRLKAEGAASPADVILAVDIARLAEYAALDLLTPVISDVLTANIPSRLRAADNRWFAFSERARIIVASKERVAAGEINDLEDLAKPQWKGRVCSRAGSHDYNRALVASMIAAHGEAAAEAWARSVVANLARKPQGNDRSQAKAIYQGLCDVAIMNSYYYGNMKFGDDADQKEWAGSIRLIFTNQGNRGNHMNVSGGGVAKYSKNRAAAVQFLEFLTGETAQRLYGEVNFEYPVNPNVSAGGELASWGKFKPDDLAIERLSELAPKAQMIIDRVGW